MALIEQVCTQVNHIDDPSLELTKSTSHNFCCVDIAHKM